MQTITMIEFVDGLLCQSKSVTLRGVEIGGIRIEEILIAPRKPDTVIYSVDSGCPEAPGLPDLDSYDGIRPRPLYHDGIAPGGRALYTDDVPASDPPSAEDEADASAPPPHLVQAAARIAEDFPEAQAHRDPFVRALLFLTRDCDSVKSNASEWIEAMRECTLASYTLEPVWPKTPEQFGRKLDRVRPDLNMLGLDVLRHPPVNGRRLIELRRRTPEAVA
jgi:hypothetical protein